MFMENNFHICSTKEFRMKIQMLMGALVIAAGGAAMAQSATPPAPGNPTATPRIDQREVNQEKRIQQGVKSGELTPRETNRLQAEQGRIQKAETKAKADGKVTAKEREHIEHMQNHASRDIKREKHDGQRDMNHDGHKDRATSARPQAAHAQGKRS
jgi:hypothetical protein